jgi:hypothetical protein
MLVGIVGVVVGVVAGVVDGVVVGVVDGVVVGVVTGVVGVTEVAAVAGVVVGVTEGGCGVHEPRGVVVRVVVEVPGEAGGRVGEQGWVVTHPWDFASVGPGEPVRLPEWGCADAPHAVPVATTPSTAMEPAITEAITIRLIGCTSFGEHLPNSLESVSPCTGRWTAVGDYPTGEGPNPG